MNRLLHAVPAVDDTVEIPVIDGEVVLDETVEIPLIGLRPAVPPRQPDRARRRPVRLRRRGWIVGLVLAAALVTAPVMARELGELPGWVLVAAVAWATGGVPVAFLVGRSIRVADQRGGDR